MKRLDQLAIRFVAQVPLDRGPSSPGERLVAGRDGDVRG